MIAAPPPAPSSRRSRLELLGAGVQRLLATSLDILNTQPQGGPWLDSQTYPDSCDATHPFHFNVFVPTKVLKINSVRLSFFLQAFRSPVAGANNVTSGPSSAASAGSSSSGTTTNDAHHHHVTVAATAVAGVDWVFYAPAGFGSPYMRTLVGGPSGAMPTDTDAGHTHDNPHNHPIPHTHDSTASLAYGIFEGAVATHVTVKINGVDRTVALGGAPDFTVDQVELEVGQWFTIGILNTVDLTPSALGRILGHVGCDGYIQSN